TISELKIKLVETDKDIQQVVHEQQRNRQQILASETAMQQYRASLLSTLPLAIPTAELLAQLSQLSLKTEDNLSRTAHILQTAEELAHEIGILRESLDTVKTLAQETEIRLVQRQHQTEQIQQCEETLKSQQIQSGQLRQEFAELHAKRLQLFADKQPDQEELLLARAVETAQKQVDNARQQLTAETQAANKLRNKAENLTNNMTSRATGLAILEESFAIRLRQSAFADEAAFMAANLAEQERKQLAQQAQQLADEKIALNTKQQDKTVALEAERLKHMTNQPQNFHEQTLAQLVTRQQALQQEIGGIQQKLKDNERIRQKQQEQLQTINAQKRECARWDLLHELIGSADGKKYRNFAQGLTFEVMIRHANRQLQKMSDRYFLIRDETRPLELSVIDNYQAGEIRSTKNLSGGESFIISLALALGLSHMVSHNIQVDSLFLDEGFGTLDEEALDTALETLASLQQQGKLIGIISHVAALQERISTRIQVIPRSGGRSRLSGPGCSHLQ
uniref:SbcC/MukB-like Walker B domain-containing protein n=1 Tax=Nitrosomonas sp. TaxID=42353 RepID=UPI0025DEA1B5